MSLFTRATYFFFWGLVLACAGCSSSGYLINSAPEGAEVSTLRGETVGKTPLRLNADLAAKISNAGMLNFKLAAPNYIPRVVLADAVSTREIFVTLPKSESPTFKSEFSKDFSFDMNQMVRRAFAIQRMIANKKNAEAATAVTEFRTEYPSLAFGHFMAAYLALQEGKKVEARKSLMRAQALDPKDPAITQSLRTLVESGGSREGAQP